MSVSLGLTVPSMKRAFTGCVTTNYHPCFGVEGSSSSKVAFWRSPPASSPKSGQRTCVHQILTNRNCSLHVGSRVVDSESTHDGCDVTVAPLDHRKRVAPTCPVGCKTDSLCAQQTQSAKRQDPTPNNTDKHPRSDVSCWTANS